MKLVFGREKTRELDGWDDGWMDGWMDGWVGFKAGLRIARVCGGDLKSCILSLNDK